MNSRVHVKAAPGAARTLLLGPSAGINSTSEITMRNAKRDAGQGQGQTMSEQARQLMEEQNNKEIASLADKVSHMKNLAYDIEAAIQEDHHLLDQTGSSFEKVTSLMRGTISNVTQMLATGGSKHMCYLILFVVCLFFGFYWLMK